MYHELIELWKNLLQLGLKEDGALWDWTSLGIFKDPRQKMSAQVIAKSEGIWAGSTLASALGSLAPSLKVDSKRADGSNFKLGDCVVEMSGPAIDILAFERPFLNLAAYVSGIATATSRLVEQVQSACPQSTPRVTLTRKTLPMYRDVAILGVRCGGGFPHRVSLSGGVLIKENHIAAAGSLAAAVRGAREVAPHGLKIEVEVRPESELGGELAELTEAINAGADGVLLDNFTPKQVHSAIQFLRGRLPRPFVEVSGGLHEGNIGSYAIQGVEILSTGSMTHSVKSVDLSLLMNRTESCASIKN